MIPCINLATLRAAEGDRKRKFLQEVNKSVSEWGVFEVEGHGVDHHLLERINGWGSKFFNLPLEAKLKASLNPYTGFVPIRSHDPSKFSSLQLAVRPQNPASTEVDELWLSSEDQKLFKKDVDQYCASMAKLALEILQLLEEALLGCDEKHGCFRNALMSSLTPESEEVHTVRFNYYGPNEEPYRVYHTDPNLISILHQNNPGLSVLKDEKELLWEPNDPSSLIINVGDALEFLSNKVLPSVQHRGAGNLDGHERITTIYFASPNQEFKLVPLEGLAITEEHPTLQPKLYGEIIRARYFSNTVV